MKEFKKLLLGLACMGAAVLGFGAEVKAADVPDALATFKYENHKVSVEIANKTGVDSPVNIKEGDEFKVTWNDGTEQSKTITVSADMQTDGKTGYEGLMDEAAIKAYLESATEESGKKTKSLPSFTVTFNDGTDDQPIEIDNNPSGSSETLYKVSATADPADITGVTFTIDGVAGAEAWFFAGTTAIPVKVIVPRGISIVNWDASTTPVTDDTINVDVDTADTTKNAHVVSLAREAITIEGVVPSGIFSEIPFAKGNITVKMGTEDITAYCTNTLTDDGKCTHAASIDFADTSFAAALKDDNTESTMTLTVTYTPSGATATATINVYKPVVTVTGTLDTVKVGGNSIVLNAKIGPEDVMNAYKDANIELTSKFAWKSLNESKAVATKEELNEASASVKGIAVGDADIEASATLNGKTCTPGKMTVHVVENSAESITIDPATLKMYKGDKKTLKATVLPVGCTSSVTWDIVEAGGNKVISITPSEDTKSADITGLDIGKVTVRATAGGKTATATVEVIPSGDSYVKFDPASVTIGIGKNITNKKPSTTEVIDAGGYGPIEVSVFPATATLTNMYIDPSRSSGDLLTFTSSDHSQLYVIGLKAGKVYLVGETSEGGTGECIITVDESAVTSFTVEDVKVTKGFTVPIITSVRPEGAAKNGYRFELSSKGSGYASIVPYNTDSKYGITGLANVSNLTLTGYVAGTNATDEASVTVYTTPTITYDKSNNSLSCSLPAGVYTGADATKNLETVTGGYIVATYGGNEVWNSADTYSTKGSNFTVSRDALQSMVESIKSKLSGDTATITMTLYPVGRSVSGAGGVRNTDINDASTKTEIVAYKVQVNGENITSATYYGIPGASLKITATPINGTSFSKWSDGTTANPRNVTVSDDTSKNSYSAVATGKNSASSSNLKRTINGKEVDGYDDVPKTGEGKEVWILWAVLLITGIFGFFAYRKLRPEAVLIRKKDNDKENK